MLTFFRQCARIIDSKQIQALGCHRYITTATPERNPNSPHPGRLPDRLVTFQIDIEQAKDAFRQHHGEQWLSPGGLLEQPGSVMRPLLLPFWLFEVSVRVEYSAEVGSAHDQSGKSEMVWKPQPLRQRYREYPWTLGGMQVYASYRYRRDLVEAAKVPGALTHTRLLTEEEAKGKFAEAGRGPERRVVLEEATMRQSIAWELALRNIRNAEMVRAEQELLSEPGIEAVKELKLTVVPLRRRARMVYLPVYIVEYAYGEYFNSAGERRPQKFQAMVGGIGSGRPQVQAERHYHPVKAQLVTAGVMGALAAAAAGVLAPLVGFNPWSLIGVETAFWGFLVTMGAGLGAQLAPHLFRQAHETEHQRAHDADMESIMRSGLGPFNPGDREHQAVRTNAEWRRWDEADRWRWDEEKRQRWAEQIMFSAHRRARQRQRFMELMDRQRDRQAAEVEQEQRRTARFGASSRHHRGPQEPFSSSRSMGSRGDPLLYYKELGFDMSVLSPTDAGPSQREVKVAFRKAAMRTHPDKVDASDEKARSRASERFKRLQQAYDVLKDPELRRRYDRGELSRT